MNSVYLFKIFFFFQSITCLTDKTILYTCFVCLIVGFTLLLFFFCCPSESGSISWLLRMLACVLAGSQLESQLVGVTRIPAWEANKDF